MRTAGVAYFDDHRSVLFGFNSANTECVAFGRYRDSQELIEQLKGSPVQIYKPFLAK